MKVALATSHGRMAPCFAGVDLRLVDEHGSLSGAFALTTHGWHPLGWGRELMRRDVSVLLCAGIDHGTWASIRGHGITVIPGAVGAPAGVLQRWRNGSLQPPELWPVVPPHTAPGVGGRRRFRGGRL